MDIKECENLDHFVDIIYEAKQSHCNIYINGKKQDKRKSLIEDIDDVFENNIPIKFQFIDNELKIFIA